MNDQITIGGKLIALRKTSELTRADVSRISGLANYYIKQLESDALTPSAFALWKLAEIYQADYTELMKLAGLSVVRSTLQVRTGCEALIQPILMQCLIWQKKCFKTKFFLLM